MTPADIIPFPNKYDAAVIAIRDGAFVLANKNCPLCHGAIPEEGQEECECVKLYRPEED